MSARGFLNNKDTRLIQPNKSTNLNPNAAEFIPSSLKSLPRNSGGKELVPASSGKKVIYRSGINASNDSDDEAHQYWNDQLPDDITPDFKAAGEKDLQMIDELSFSGLSIHDGIKDSQFGATSADQFSGRQETFSVNGVTDIDFSEIVRFPSLGYTKDPFTHSTNLPPSLWNKNHGKSNQPKGREQFHAVDLKTGYQSDDTSLSSIHFNPLEYLAAEFPGFSVDCVAEVYYKNGCDLNLTAERLNQLVLEVDGGFKQSPSSKALSASSVASSITRLDFPALSLSDEQNGLLKCGGEDLKHSFGTYQPSEKGSFPFTKHIPSGTSRDALDFSAICRFASHDSDNWKYSRNGSLDMNIGSSGSSQSLLSPYSGQKKSMYTDKLEGMGKTGAASFWLETGDVAGNMYSKSREEACDLARLRTACFEQASQAYLLGNRPLAKELSMKGQLLDSQMKASHEKARENIYRQRHQVAPEVQNYSRGQDPLINLHGLHVTEAIHVLNHELNILRRTARSAGQRLQVMIYVGTGHQIKGSHIVPRLPVTVERYLLEQGLQFSEPQPGLLRVVLY